MPNFPKRRFFSNSLPTPGGGGGSGDMILANAQTSTGKKTFNSNATFAGLNIGPIAAIPSTLVDGDIWYQVSGGGGPKIVQSSVICGFLTSQEPGLSVGRLIGAQSEFTTESSEIQYGSSFLTMGTPTNPATTQTLSINGSSANINFNIRSKGTGTITIGLLPNIAALQLSSAVGQLTSPNGNNLVRVESVNGVTLGHTFLTFSNAVGSRFAISRGITNSYFQTVTLVGGTGTVATTAVTANSTIFMTPRTVSGTQGFLRYTVIAGTSVTVTSSNVADTSVIDILIIN